MIGSSRTQPQASRCSASFLSQNRNPNLDRRDQRYKKLLAKGKNKGVVVTAIGRELLGFIWAIGIKVETAQKESLQQAA